MTFFNLITGFLGSGKTTLLANLLQELSGEKRIAVIQNEFAPTGVDGKELSRNAEGFKLIEINNGSVFCVCQLSNFTSTMQKLLSDYKPEIIFLEASGLADPISIMELLQTPELKNDLRLDKIISLVDAANFFKGLNTLVRFKHQIMVADTIILNKTDLYEGDLGRIEKEITTLNPYAEILRTTYANIPWEMLELYRKERGQAAQRYFGKQSEGRPDMSACVLRSHDKISRENLEAFMKELQPQCPRIKALLNISDGSMVSVQSVYDVLQIKTLNNYKGPSELIAFGNGLNVSDLRKRFKYFANKE